MEEAPTKGRFADSDAADVVDVLHSYVLAHGDRVASFDLLCRVAAVACGAPYALLGLVAGNRSWPLATYGLANEVLPWDSWFCEQVVRAGQPVVISDAAVDQNDDSCTRSIKEAGRASGAGVPLAIHDGTTLGSLCVFDPSKRQYTSGELNLLVNIAELASAMLEMRRTRPLFPSLAPVDRVNSIIADALTIAPGAKGPIAALRGLSSSIEAALRQLPLTNDYVEFTSSDFTQRMELTSREGEIVGRLLAGDRVPAIAQALHVSQSTIRNHLSSVFRKLGVKSQQELVDLARKWE